MKIILLLIICLAGGLYFLSDYQAQRAVVARTAITEMRMIRNTISLPGTVISLHRAKVPGPRAGRLLKVHVKEGQEVQAGQTLAALDSREVLVWLQSSQAELRLAKTEIEHISRKLERLRSVSITGGESVQHVESAISELHSAEARADIAKAELERARIAVSDSKIVSPLDGIIVRRYARPGEWIEPARPLFRIAEANALVVEAKVDGASITVSS
jgi:membrane fusion protein (multidrug efflux system)